MRKERDKKNNRAEKVLCFKMLLEYDMIHGPATVEVYCEGAMILL